MSSKHENFEFEFDQGMDQEDQTVICLGKKFKNDEERRVYFTELLREKLKDPEFRKIEGFPIAEDEDILALSDPPYYTACPNPWLQDIIEEWEKQKPAKPEGYVYKREPYAADVSEGKNDPIYNAHSYHTKVPHKAIMRYILHYTEPGDIVFDGFCGTGMTGVAAQLCGDRDAVCSLGYRVEEDGTILREETDENGKKVWVPFSKLGPRRAVLNDLSPAATFIAYNYNTPVDVASFEREAKRILKEVEAECGWMYETLHTDGKTKGRINYTVWSDVFVCPNCLEEIVFWEAAVDKEQGKVLGEFPCPHCQAMLTKRNMERAWITKYDPAIDQNIRQAKQVPVLINYSVGNKRYEKTPDQFDLELINKIDNSEIPYWYPTEELPDGYNTRQPKGSHGITHVHHFYTKRNLWVLATFYNAARKSKQKLCVFFIQYAALGFSKLARYVPNHYSQVNQYLSGTLYIASQQVEVSPEYILYGKLKRLVEREAPRFGKEKEFVISCDDSSQCYSPKEKFDYIFLDPPFGSNLNYSELNFLWESWLKVWTNNKPEAIENSVQGKGLNEYRQIMTACFKEAYRVLKPGRWMTVEFSNTSAAVWNSIQTALMEAGFIVANVSALDKKQGSFKAVTTPTAVKQDLVISAYKPNDGFEERFLKVATTEAGVWEFVRTHLKYLPVVKKQNGALLSIPERDPRILYDQMVAYYVRKGYSVPLSSQEFQQGLAQRFEERDGMYFLPEQVLEYDRQRMTAERLEQIPIFVTDEASAVQWLKQLLKNKPQTYQEIHPQFIQETQRAWNKFEKPIELRDLLEQNFLCYDGRGPVPSQIHAYLSSNFKDLRNLDKEDPALKAKAKDRWYVPDPSKAGDLEKLREKSLLREFEEYKKAPQRRLKAVRLEAVRAGFKKAWGEKDYQTIVEVGRKLPEKILQEDDKLLMYYDNAQIRLE